MKPRSSSALKRTKPYLPPREKILIVCEGKKTEPNYFQALIREWRLTSVKVCGKECGSAPISVVDYAIEKNDTLNKTRGEIPFSKTWCVMDVEIPQHLSLNEAIDKASAHKLEIVLSNPCFEYWFLLHFEKTAQLMNNNERPLEYLKKHYRTYSKGDTEIYSVIFPLTEKAIANSRQIINEKNYLNDYNGDLRKCNPSTNVHLLVEYLQNMIQ